MSNDLEREFDAAMMNIYVRALREADYPAHRYHQMLCEYGGLETAKRLVNAQNVSEGYTALWERKRLDLTVEALIQKKKWRELFSEEELKKAQKRLRTMGGTLAY